MAVAHDLTLYAQIIQAIRLVEDRMRDVPHGGDLDPTTSDAVLWRLTVIGQCTGRLSDEARAAHPEVDWEALRRLQQIAAGSLGGLTRDEVWRNVDVALPELRVVAERELDSADPGRDHHDVRQARVLLVDDDPDIRRILGLLLTHAGYAVTDAGDGEEALALAQRERPDAIIADVQMPRLDGIQLVGHLRQVPGLERTPILLFTGQPPSASLDTVLGMERVRYMSKGDPKKVITALGEMLDGGLALHGQAAPAAH